MKFRHVDAVLAHVVGESDSRFEVTSGELVAIELRVTMCEIQREDRMLRIDAARDPLVTRDPAQLTREPVGLLVEVDIDLGMTLQMTKRRDSRRTRQSVPAHRAADARLVLVIEEWIFRAARDLDQLPRAAHAAAAQSAAD